MAGRVINWENLTNLLKKEHSNDTNYKNNKITIGCILNWTQTYSISSNIVENGSVYRCCVMSLVELTRDVCVVWCDEVYVALYLCFEVFQRFYNFSWKFERNRVEISFFSRLI